MCSLSIIIVNWNTRDLLRSCLLSLADGDLSAGLRDPSSVTSSVLAEVIVVDNASQDDSTAMLQEEFPAVRLISNSENVGFARGNNQGIAVSKRQYIVLLNSDTVIPPGALATLVCFMETHPDAGAVGPRLLRTDGTPQSYAFGCDPTLGYLLRRGVNAFLFKRALHDWNTDVVQTVDWVSGACMVLRHTTLEQTGALDENIFLYFEDNDLCLRMRQAGWRVYYYPQIGITHIGGESLRRNPAAQRAYYQSLAYFYTKHYGMLACTIMKALLAVYRGLVRW